MKLNGAGENRLRRSIPLILLTAMLVGSAVPARSLAQAPPAQPGLTILEVTADSLLLELNTPAPTLDTVTTNGQTFDTILVDDSFEWVDQPGRPLLPIKSTLLGVPELSTVATEVVLLEEEILPGQFHVYPAPQAVPVHESEPGQRPVDPENPQAGGTEFQFAYDADFYSQNLLFPAEVVQVRDKAYVRDQVVARLYLHPFRVNPATGELHYTSRIRVRVIFDGGRASSLFVPTDGDPPGGPDPLVPRLTTFDQALSSTLLNYEQALAWRVPRSSALQSQGAVGAFRETSDRYRVETIGQGLVDLDFATLSDAGMPVDTVVPANLTLHHGDQAMPLEVVGGEDGSFDPGDKIRFFAEQIDSIYTWRDVYWLGLGDTAGSSTPTRNVNPAAGGTTPTSFPATTHFEESSYYQSDLPKDGFEEDRWYWAFTAFRPRNPILTRTVTITLGIPVAAPEPAVLTAELRGATSYFLQNPDHYARLLVNGTLVGEAYWDGLGASADSFGFDSTVLQAGPNTFTLNTPGGLADVEQDIQYLNWLEFAYPHAYTAVDDQLYFSAAGPGQKLIRVDGFTEPNLLLYDISDPLAPVRLTGFTVNQQGGSHRLSFSDALGSEVRQYLATTADRIGAAVQVSHDPPLDLHDPVSGADYLLITHGDFMPAAEALAQHRATTGFTPLVIDVQDIYNDFNGGRVSPVAIRDFLAHAYSNWPDPAPMYVLLLGDGVYDFKDYLNLGSRTYIPPLLDAVDPFIGETATDNGYVTIVGNDPIPDLHIGRMPANSLSEAWTMVNKTIGYEANPAEGDWVYRTLFVADNADLAGNFAHLSDQIADNLVPAPYQVDKVYYGVNYTNVLNTRDVIRQKIDEGVLLANYVGHSSITWWAAEILLASTTAPLLVNQNRLPVMLPMTCFEGYFHSPLFASLAESLVRASSGGAVASWSATGRGVATGHDYLHRGFYQAVFQAGARRLGPATLAGKITLYTDDDRFRDLIETYDILGDPALELALADADLQLQMAASSEAPVQAGQQLTYTLNYVNNLPGPVPNAVITAAVPSALVDLQIVSSHAGVTQRPGTTPMVWDLGPLGQGEGGQITVTGRVPDVLSELDVPLTAGGRILSVWRESTLGNNKGGPLDLGVLPTDVSIALAPDQPGSPGGTISLQVSYENLGPAPATRPTVALDLGFDFQLQGFSYTGPEPTLEPGPDMAWELPTLPVGTSGTITIQGQLGAGLSVADIPLLGQAAIETGWPDRNLANNQTEQVALPFFVADAHEPDDQATQATALSLPGSSTGHTHSAFGDVDWYRFDAQADTRFRIRIENLSLGGDTLLSLYSAGGELLITNDDYLPGSGWSGLDWRAPGAGTYYLTVRNAPSGLPGFRYDLSIALINHQVFLPVLLR